MIGFVAAHGYAFELFDPRLRGDKPCRRNSRSSAAIVNIQVDADRFSPPWVLRDYDFCAAFVQILDDPVWIEGFVGDQTAEVDVLNERRHANAVEAMSRQQLEPHQIAQGIGESEDPRFRA